MTEQVQKLHKIAMGGGCHWCTEAVFQVLKGVVNVEQGFVSSIGENQSFSEAVILHFNPQIIHLKTLIEVHLCTHSSQSNHSMRKKYRSAIYTFSKEQTIEAQSILEHFQQLHNDKIITKVYPFSEFKPSRSEFLNYYQNNPQKPFCQTYITPKLKHLLKQFSASIDLKKVDHLTKSLDEHL